MKGFFFVHRKWDNERVMLALDFVGQITKEDDCVSIRQKDGTCFLASEQFSDVVEAMRECQG